MLESQLCQVLLIQRHSVGASRLLQSAHAEYDIFVAATEVRLSSYLQANRVPRSRPMCRSTAAADVQQRHDMQIGCASDLGIIFPS